MRLMRKWTCVQLLKFISALALKLSQSFSTLSNSFFVGRCKMFVSLWTPASLTSGLKKGSVIAGSGSYEGAKASWDWAKHEHGILPSPFSLLPSALSSPFAPRPAVSKRDTVDTHQIFSLPPCFGAPYFKPRVHVPETLYFLT